MTELEYYPSFTSYSDNYGNTSEDLTENTTSLRLKFDTPILRPGDEVELKVRAIDPRGRRMEVVFRRDVYRQGSPFSPQVISDGEEAVFKWVIDANDVGHGTTFALMLTALDTEYHRSGSRDQTLNLTYTTKPPADY